MRSTITRIEELRGLKTTVMGLGLHGGGLTSARFLAESGAIVTVTDMKDKAELADSIAALEGLPIRYVLGRHELGDFSAADLVVKNPAVRPDSPYILSAKAVETDISLFLRFSNSPIIAITGSKGKSSVSSAIYHVLSSSGVAAFLGGNITVSPLTFLDRCGPETPVVLELSSWQLADIKDLGVLKPRIAILTSIMPDHMNRYGSMEEYVADKRLIYSDQDASCSTICNWDDPWGRSFASETRGEVLWYSDLHMGLPGAWLESATSRRGLYSVTGDIAAAEEIMPRKLLVPGDHQRKNMLAAALACRAYGIDAAKVSEAIASFSGVEHRLERFAEKDGISWYNDSAATIPQAVGAALTSFDGPVILITGGTDKNLDFEPLRSEYSKAKITILLSGTGTEKLKVILDKEGVPFVGPYDDLGIAVSAAISRAKPGDTVLLSPGCASFGMFKNEFDRGRKFKDTVREMLGT
ncbi:MAG: UDP-N-acetylmuramoyl-L-alanine--D-glutamate ligase [Rectinemataceae bacterium]